MFKANNTSEQTWKENDHDHNMFLSKFHPEQNQNMNGR